ncbi:cell wall hydrolase [Roseivivax sediminis]|uniref:Cell Wall Hydrolase n=1 Tax=Roseivivax sediminis TaxID=936889 RepID=A0A1I1VB86_9RHOB|nr:cell wall hydrolase [Roseivivax sediminis]SFD80174.1 Cell Wall Hydrolase [Roseivivax sediminis]
MPRSTTRMRCAALIACLSLLAACGGGGQSERMRLPLRASEVDCMARAMYFESVRSSHDGMTAVGTVVMNRVQSPEFPDTVCAVVGQRGQFAPGVMSRRMRGESELLARAVASEILRGERHPMVENARFFHAATYNAGYNNMHYVLTAGGNAFYEKRSPQRVTQPVPLAPLEGITGR